MVIDAQHAHALAPSKVTLLSTMQITSLISILFKQYHENKMVETYALDSVTTHQFVMVTQI